MNPGTKKSSGKTVRVATTFTGAAACAFAFAPTALAGTHQPTGQPGQQARQARVDIYKMRMASSWQSRTLSGSTSVGGSIRNGNCLGTNQSHWVHLAGYPYVTCFGFRGTYHIPPFYFYASKECGGTNEGYLITTSDQKISFEPGTTYRGIGHFIKSVHISSWTGTDKCPLHP